MDVVWQELLSPLVGRPRLWWKIVKHRTDAVSCTHRKAVAGAIDRQQQFSSGMWNSTCVTYGLMTR